MCFLDVVVVVVCDVCGVSVCVHPDINSKLITMW